MYKDDDMHKHRLYDMPNALVIHLCHNYVRNFIDILYDGFRNNFNIFEVVKFNTSNVTKFEEFMWIECIKVG